MSSFFAGAKALMSASNITKVSLSENHLLMKVPEPSDPIKPRSSLDDLKSRLFEQSLASLSEFECPPNCSYGKECIGKQRMRDVLSVRIFFWGKRKERAPNRGERREKMKSLLDSFFDKRRKEFEFSLPGNEKEPMCEWTFLACLGLVHDPSDTKTRSDAWTDLKKTLVEGGSVSMLIEKDSPTNKQDTAQAWIALYKQSKCEAIPIAFGENAHIVPYEGPASFYKEYQHDKGSGACCETTFRAALASFGHNLRFLTGKGSFNTCGVCNGLATLLHDTSTTFNNKQREVIQKYRLCHLQQQAAERAQNALHMEMARTTFDVFGQPTKFYFDIDGMTESKGFVPVDRAPGGRQSNQAKAEAVLENRPIGVHVICGGIDTLFMFYTDQFVNKGANIMLEVMRQSMFELSRLLAEKGQRLPREHFWQFDNSGENKVPIIMFLYLYVVDVFNIFRTSLFSHIYRC